MTQIRSQPDPITVSDLLQKRIETLGAGLAWIDPDGSVYTHGPTQWIQRVLLESPHFCQSLSPHLNALRVQAGYHAAIWPGVSLVSLTSCPRQADGTDHPPGCDVAVLLTQSITDSEQLAVVCDQQHLDQQTARARIDTHQLLDPNHANQLAQTIGWLANDANLIQRHNRDLKQFSAHLGEAYEELSLLNRFSTSLTVDHPPDHIINHACQEMQQVAGLQWLAIQLADDEPRLDHLAGRLFIAGQISCQTHMMRRIAFGLMRRLADDPQPLVIDDTKPFDLPHLARLTRQLLVVPMVHGSRLIGILFGGDKSNGSPISSIDTHLGTSLGASLSIFLANTMLYADMHAMFMGTMHALTRSIDAKDPYTFGHSERVALVSKQLAQAAGLEPHQIERVHIAGLIHDVGKIGVPEAVLQKTGPLDLHEFNLIKQHPQIGARILADIRQMQDLIPGVLYHHERWDGLGYPHQLEGENIPLLGRLVSLADAFDAMSSSRTYRSSMKHEQVIAEIRRCSGSQFDPQLAAVFLDLDFYSFFQLLHKHQAQQTNQKNTTTPTANP